MYVRHVVMRAKALVVVFCGLICVLMFPASSGAFLGPETPEECTFEEGEMGRYIIVFHNWVDDPAALAKQQAAEYGGELTHIYSSALKGYAAGYTPLSANALQIEPTVNYIEIDHLMWWDESSGVIQWRSCPLAPPLGPPPPPKDPVPPDGSDPPEQLEPESLDEVFPGGLDQSSAPGSIESSADTLGAAINHGVSSNQDEHVAPHTNRCERRANPKRCTQSRGRVHRKGCNKRKVADRRGCSRGA